MPTYDYLCSDGHEFAVTQKITEGKLKTCKENGCDKPVKRLLTQGNFILKGGGWTPKSSI